MKALFYREMVVGHQIKECEKVKVPNPIQDLERQVAEMLSGAAGSLVGIGSALPLARALARRYISLFVAPLVSIAAATTAQLRISVVIVLVKYH